MGYQKHKPKKYPQCLALSKERAYKLFDEKGLYLFIRPNGAKYWRLKYRFEGKENGGYLEVGYQLEKTG